MGNDLMNFFNQNKKEVAPVKPASEVKPLETKAVETVKEIEKPIETKVEEVLTDNKKTVDTTNKELKEIVDINTDHIILSDATEIDIPVIEYQDVDLGSETLNIDQVFGSSENNEKEIPTETTKVVNEVSDSANLENTNSASELIEEENNDEDEDVNEDNETVDFNTKAESQETSKDAAPVINQGSLFAMLGASGGIQATVKFKYNNKEEVLTNLEQTFDAFRKTKERDFSEFEKADKVVWQVTYLVFKDVKTPIKTTIAAMKAEIEALPEFIKALEKNKNPLVMEIKPRVSGQSKGACRI